MITLSIEADLKRAVAGLSALTQKQIPFATATALTLVVKQAQAAEQAALPSVFDRPTPFTQKGIAVVPATKGNPAAAVYVRPTQAGYLTLEETGGTRTPAKRALLMPVDAKRNAYGNLPRRALQTLKGRRDVFVGTVHGVGGVWQRPARGTRRDGTKGTKGKLHGKAGQRTGLTLLIAFDDDASYQARFGFRPRAEAVIRNAVGPAFVAALRQALKTAR